MRKDLGIITLTKGHLTITDPCYTQGIWCTGTVENVFCGDWDAFMEINDFGNWGDRVTSLTIQAKGQSKVRSEKLDADIGVDAGLCGIFEDKPDLDDVWDSLCDNVFLKTQGGIANTDSLFRCAGAWSHSGFGDGSYDAYVGYNKDGKVVEVTIDYLCDDEEDD